MKLFDAKVRVREQEVDGVSNWLWPKTDHGAWDGPSAEWERTHKDGYLKYCKSFDVVVQAGGNCGLYPRLLAKYFKHVYTFEPDALNFHCLVNNCQESNIIKINGALGGRNELVGINNSNESNVGTFTIDLDGVPFIPTFTIDQLNLRQCDLIQLDCEGYEPNIIDGALETITKFKPVISMETTNAKTDAMMNALGYIHMISVGADKIFAVRD